MSESTDITPNKKYIPDSLENLPGFVDIFAISLTASYNITFHTENIMNYFPLDKLNISTIESKLKTRTCKKKQKKTKKIQKNLL